MYTRNLFFGVVVLLFLGCNPKPKPIEYGSDNCHFCRMTIVDALHAAEVVTNKGKVFKFDAVECMVNYRKEIDPNEISLYLCNHYSEPKELIDATQATFLISENIPSPMGEFLTAFKTADEAHIQQKDNGGELYSWDELLTKFNR
ncbi:nitrous oxide reductase accessory protein NosL [Flagellimonas nanhaiensis]|uniref:Copper chaperone NosL n=1 Tax=Flagellimonas nanhaiensis TaxID=2292706 RepID=A0A371JS34_9FLAO|nr:nitrous oxide reductase accessory protein NosL [Allomuricauda nanhaiensis]RDY60623.1 hypothetical protein DX873_00110 [Allomuricauda nanhaiensis]